MGKTKELFEDLLVEPCHCLLLAHRVHIQVDQIGHLEIVTTVTLQESTEPPEQLEVSAMCASLQLCHQLCSISHLAHFFHGHLLFDYYYRPNVCDFCTGMLEVSQLKE